jgi:hypothetical protein
MSRDKTPTITFEFPSERQAKQFAKDISNAAVGMTNVIGKQVDVEVLPGGRGTQRTIDKYTKQNRGKQIKESIKEGKFDSDPRIKKMSDEGKRLLAWMANSFEETGGPYLDKNNVQHLTKHAVDRIMKKLKKLKNLPPDKKKEMKLVMKELGEGVEEEMTTTTSVGTVSDPLDIPPKKKKRKCEMEKFIGSRVFEVSNDEYCRCIKGRNKFERWNKFFEKDSETGSAIKRYSQRNPNSPVIIKDESTGEMVFLRRRLNDQRLKHNSRSRS